MRDLNNLGNTFSPGRIIIFTFMKFRFEVGIFGMLLMTQYFLLERIVQNMQMEFTSINFDNEHVDMIKVDCVSQVSPEMIRNVEQNIDRFLATKIHVFRSKLLLSNLMYASSVLLCPALSSTCF